MLQRKILAGANFILTQPIYKAELVTVFLEQYRDAYENLPIPLLVGLLPLASSRHAIFLQNEVPGISIPAEIHQRMSAAGQNGAQEGIKIAIELALQIRKHAQGIYIMPAFNRFDYVAEIIEAVKGEA